MHAGIINTDETNYYENEILNGKNSIFILPKWFCTEKLECSMNETLELIRVCVSPVSVVNCLVIDSIMHCSTNTTLLLSTLLYFKRSTDYQQTH